MPTHCQTERRVLRGAVLGFALLGLLCPGPLWAQRIYRWVGPHGTVHYSDVPHGSHYQRVHVGVPSTFAEPGASPAPQAPSVKPRAQPKPPAQKIPGLTPAQARTFCHVARDRYQKLQPVRRLELVQPNGKPKFLTGQNLQSYKDAARSRMQLFCGQEHPSGG